MHHSQAVWIGYNIADRVRANMPQFDDYHSTDTRTTYSQDCSGGCNAKEIVVSDQQDWATAIQNLPGGVGLITQTDDVLLIQVMWDDEGTGATGETCGGESNDLTCYTVTLNR